MKIRKGDWVQIHKIVLKSKQRAPQVPEDTKNVPLEQWVKGFLEADANMGDEVTIRTITGRVESGKLVAVNPTYSHGFGKFVPEVSKIGLQLRAILHGGE